MAMKGYAAMSPAFPKGKGKKGKVMKRVPKQTEGNTPRSARAREKRLEKVKM